MRIIGGHDYYDSGMAWGQDTGTMFVRGDRTLLPADVEKMGVPCFGFGASFAKADGRSPGNLTVSTAQVIVCGKSYSGLKIVYGSYTPYFPNPQHGEFWFWDLAALEAWAAERKLTIHPHDLGMTRWHWAPHSDNVTYVAPIDFFGPKELPKAVLSRLIDDRITILSYTPGDYSHEQRKHFWRIDQSVLRPMQFFRAIDATTAFQEISMWVGGVLGAVSPEIVEITDDKVKIAKKGFDLRSSFRRMKRWAA